MNDVTTKEKKTFEKLKDVFGYTSMMAAPRITKVVVSTGTGRVSDKGTRELIQDRLARITGQKSSPRPAKKSIATFKTRQGQIIGYQVTLRGARARDFVDRLINISLPRTRDFRGINRSAVDSMGNLTVGIPEHTIFPETADEELRDVFGLAVTVVTTAHDKKEAMAFFEHLGVPFKKA